MGVEYWAFNNLHMSVSNFVHGIHVIQMCFSIVVISAISFFFFKIIINIATWVEWYGLDHRMSKPQ